MGDTKCDQHPTGAELGVQTKPYYRLCLEKEDPEDNTINEHHHVCCHPNSNTKLMGQCDCLQSKQHNQLTKHSTTDKDLLVVKSVQHSFHCLRTQVNPKTVVYLLLSCAFGLSLAFNFQWDRQRSAELRDLREEVENLKASCQRHLHSYKASHSNVVDSAFAGGAAETESEVKVLLSIPVEDTPTVRNWEQAGKNNEDGDEEIEEEDVIDEIVEDEEVESNKEEREILPRFRRNALETDNANSKKTKRSKQKDHCKKFKQCKAEKDNGKNAKGQCKRILQCCEDCSSKPSFTPRAVHFMSDFWDGRRQEEFGKDVCKYFKDWDGIACRNRTFRAGNDKTPLKFFKPADWMKDVYSDESEQPFKRSNDGYTVTQSGLYLIYSSVMFHDLKPRQSQAVVVNGHKLFKCMDSVDYVDTDLPPEDNQAKYKTCAMTGVTHLMSGDRLEVQNLYANTEIDLSTDATYFGAVLLSPGEVKPRKG